MTDVGPLDHGHGGSKVPRGVAVGELAGSQGGVVGRRQLLHLGVGRGAIDNWLATGRLHQFHEGVYAVGHTALGEKGRNLAAVLACGPGALLSHRSAAADWGLRPTSRSSVDVTALGRSRHRRRGIDVHRPRRFETADRTVRDGVPVTTVSRTLLDLAEVVPRRELARATEQAERLGVFDLAEMEELLGRSRGRRGMRPLRRVLAVYGEVPMTRSELERRFLGLCESAGLPRPLVNTSIAGIEVDMYWPNARLAVELDSWEYHRTRSAFERDRERDEALQGTGIQVRRLTDRRLMRDADGVFANLRTALASE